MHFSVISAYIIGLVVCIVFFAVSALVANLIAYDASMGRKDISTRRFWFWILGILVPLVVFLVSWLAVYNDLRVPSQRVSYMSAMCVSSASMFVLYVVLGILFSKVMKKSKLGSWF